MKLFFLCLLPLSLLASITRIESMSQVPIDSPSDTIYFFDIDDTLIDSPNMLGSKAWRKYIAETLPDLHDVLTLFVARNYPVDYIEGYTPKFIEQLQNRGYGVFGLTARERNIWYYTPTEGIDALTIAQLKEAEIYLNPKTHPSSPEYYEGVFFADIEPKGDYLKKLFQNIDRPAKVIFIDDKLSQVESVEKALSELGIENECYWYTYTDNKLFHPLIANIQLFHLLTSKSVLSDEAACNQLIILQ